MGLQRTDEFRQDAVRIALTSGLTRKQVADDLGVGMSTLNKWITARLITKNDTAIVCSAISSVGPSRLAMIYKNYLQRPIWLFLRKNTNLHFPLDGCAMS